LKEIIDQIIIPVLEGLVIGFFVGVAAFFVSDINIAIFWGLVSCSLVSMFGFNQRIPKKYQQVKFQSNRTMSSETQPIQTYHVEAWVEDPGKWGAMLSSPIGPEILERIGWHILFLDGKISHPYLTKKWGILGRDDVTNLQYALVKAEWAKFKGKDNKGGMILLDKGESFFKGAGRRYKQLNIKEKEALNYVLTNPTPLLKLEIAKWVTGRDTSQTNIIQT
jgi:hypothetical protein